MSILRWIRNTFAARRERARREAAAIPHFVRCQLARHRVRLDAAIVRNNLSVRNEASVRRTSDDYLAAFQRGRIASVDDVTLMCLDHCNRLGNEQALLAKRLAVAPASDSVSPSFLAQV